MARAQLPEIWSPMSEVTTCKTRRQAHILHREENPALNPRDEVDRHRRRRVLDDDDSPNHLLGTPKARVNADLLVTKPGDAEAVAWKRTFQCSTYASL